MTTQVAIDRSGLSLADLVIGTWPDTTDFWLPEDGLGDPGYTWRRSYATAAYVTGSLQTQAVLEQATLPLVVYIGATSSTVLRSRVDALTRALRQFYFTTTVTVDDVAETWGCDCADIGPATYDPGMVAERMQRREVSIPVYPVSGSL